MSNCLTCNPWISAILAQGATQSHGNVLSMALAIHILPPFRAPLAAQGPTGPTGTGWPHPHSLHPPQDLHFAEGPHRGRP